MNGTNPLNVDSPNSQAEFVEQFNTEAVQFIEQASGYQVMVQEVVAANELGEQLVNMVRSLLYALREIGNRIREEAAVRRGRKVVEAGEKGGKKVAKTVAIK